MAHIIDPKHLSLMEIKDYYNQEIGMLGYAPGEILLPFELTDEQQQLIEEGKAILLDYGEPDYAGRFRFIRLVLESLKQMRDHGPQTRIDPEKLADFILI